MYGYQVRLGSHGLKQYRITFDVDGIREENIIITSENKTDARTIFKKLVGNKKIKSIEETKDVRRR